MVKITIFVFCVFLVLASDPLLFGKDHVLILQLLFCVRRYSKHLEILCVQLFLKHYICEVSFVRRITVGFLLVGN